MILSSSPYSLRVASDSLIHVHRFRRAALHPVRQLVRRDPRRQLGAAGILLQVELVQLGEQIEPGALLLRADLGRRLQIDDRVAASSGRRVP